MPELDDEFAKGIRDGYESLEALGDHVRQQLTEAANTSSDRRLEQDSLEELLTITKIQASELIYQRELDMLYQERERSVRGQRLDMETYLSYIGTTEDEWREQLKPQAERRLDSYLVLRKLAQDQGIDISPEEIQAEIDDMLGQSGEAQESMRQVLGSDNARESIRSSLLNRKVLRRLVEIIEGGGEETPSLEEAEPVMDVDEEASGAESQVSEGNEEGSNA